MRRNKRPKPEPVPRGVFTRAYSKAQAESKETPETPAKRRLLGPSPDREGIRPPALDMLSEPVALGNPRPAPPPRQPSPLRMLMQPGMPDHRMRGPMPRALPAANYDSDADSGVDLDVDEPPPQNPGRYVRVLEPGRAVRVQQREVNRESRVIMRYIGILSGKRVWEARMYNGVGDPPEMGRPGYHIL